MLKYGTLLFALQREFNFRDLLPVVQHELSGELDTTNVITGLSPQCICSTVRYSVVQQFLCTHKFELIAY
jgi:hypothetical protein